MTTEKDALVQEIGALILADPRYEGPWEELALVADLTGSPSMHGYVYLADGGFEARVPGFDVLRRIRTLHAVMAEAPGGAWHQCLVHLTRPDLTLSVEFEHDDPDRWGVREISRDMSVYAASLRRRPPAEPRASV